MKRSKQERLRLFTQYEGLAIRAATRLWSKWEPGLRGRCLGLDDLCQDARVILLELCGRMDRRRGERGCRAYLVKSLNGRLFNLIRAEVYPKVPTVSADLRSFSDKLEEFPPTLPDFSLTFNQRTALFCSRMLAGDSEAEARRAVGWTRADQREALAELRRELEQG